MSQQLIRPAIDTLRELNGDGRPITKTDQVRMCGNSVCPPLAAALVSAQFNEQRQRRWA